MVGLPGIKVLGLVGRVYTLLISRDPEAGMYGELEKMDPLLLEPLPLKLEDLFEWKMGGLPHGA